MRGGSPSPVFDAPAPRLLFLHRNIFRYSCTGTFSVIFAPPEHFPLFLHRQHFPLFLHRPEQGAGSKSAGCLVQRLRGGFAFTYYAAPPHQVSADTPAVATTLFAPAISIYTSCPHGSAIIPRHTPPTIHSYTPPPTILPRNLDWAAPPAAQSFALLFRKKEPDFRYLVTVS